jgi:hypothetical protein
MSRRTASKRLIAIAGLASSLLLGARPVFAINISASQPVVRETLKPGSATQGTIELTNAGDIPVQVKLYMEDWRYAEAGDGNKDFGPPGTFPRSAADWIRFRPQQVEIAPGKTAVVDYSITVPQDSTLDGGYYAVLFFESMIADPSQAEADSVAVKYAARLGSLFLIEIDQTVRREATMQGVQIAVDAALPLRLKGSLSNEGNVSLKCAGTFHVMSAQGMVAARGELPMRYAWPGNKVPFEAEWPGKLASGSYSVVATYDCGDDLVLVEEVAASVP